MCELCFHLANQPEVIVWLTSKQAFDIFKGNYKDSGISYKLYKCLTDKNYPEKAFVYHK